MLIRRPRRDEVEQVEALVRAVAAESYPEATPSELARAGNEDWTEGWIAVDDAGAIAGVTLVTEEWIDDLWVGRAHRSQGVGALLLAHAEIQIAALGHSEARLRVVAANTAARKFYTQHGYTVAREFEHERLVGRAMVELEKKLG
jgi:ribosomal protein S18 acetylase RimI-like enzyme